ncbi:MAG: ATP-binding cassette domain-containing protein [Thermoguttaceae bacterium]
MTAPSHRRLLVPDVIQTSAMDCGPAVLKCLLEGYGIPVHYGRLREACQTDVDGTSIDVLEEVARQFGLDAEQEMMPVDHLLLGEADALPAILVVRQPGGLTHFVLVWRRHGPWVQVMDPAIGRRWTTCRQLLDDAYVHSHRIPAAAWRDWAASDGMCRPLARRLRDLGLGGTGRALIDHAANCPGWRSMATLDAVTRLVQSLVRARGIRRGHEAHRMIVALIGEAGPGESEPAAEIPEKFWSVCSAPAGPDGEELVELRGAVLVHVRGRQPTSDRPAPMLNPELAAALAQPASRPGRELLRLVRGAGLQTFLVLAFVLVLVAGFAVLEALLLRGVIDVGHDLTLVGQRLEAIGVLLALVAAVSVLEWRLRGGLFRLGRRLEAALRVAFLEKIPRLNDRYFQSRPTSDMAERGHSLHQVRLLPPLAGDFLRTALTLVITAAAIAWVSPHCAPLAMMAAGLAVALPVIMVPLLQGLDLRIRTHTGALARFYLDALLGLSAIRAHGAQRSVRREHEGLLVEWARASQHLLRWVVLIEGLQLLIGLGLAGWLLILHASATADAAGLLLVGYWALSLPVLGEQVARIVRQYPMHRNVVLRFLEPLGAPEDPVGQTPSLDEVRLGHHVPMVVVGPTCCGVSIALRDVAVRAAGQRILEGVDLDIPAGSHVAIVGTSGAGKSSLVGILLGWHRASSGRVLVDGQALDAAGLDRLRKETAWVDPAIHLWNQSLFHNLLYGIHAEPQVVAEVIRQADLYEVLQRLPEGLQTSLGEGGGLLSGGEGQRVKLGRAMARPQARLVVLDEPFRGLDREKRGRLLRSAREVWRHATLLCVTHDVSETLGFPRVLVIDQGRIVEDAPPETLSAAPGSRYRSLLEAEESLRAGLWTSRLWRRLRLESGHLAETTAERSDGGRS